MSDSLPPAVAELVQEAREQVKDRRPGRLGEKRGKEHIPETRNIVRLLHEAGAFSLVKISEVTGIALNTIKHWKSVDKWETKGALQPAVGEFTRNRFIEKMAEIGLPPEKVLKQLRDGITKPKDRVFTEDGKPIQSTPDWNTRHKYLQDYWKISGIIGNNKGDGINATPGEGGTVNIQINLPEKEEP